jgi:hypothetical protein
LSRALSISIYDYSIIISGLFCGDRFSFAGSERPTGVQSTINGFIM